MCHAAGRETLLDEDLTDEQIEDELAPVTVQLAYASSQLGNPAEALSTYEVCVHIDALSDSAPQGVQLQSPGLHESFQSLLVIAPLEYRSDLLYLACRECYLVVQRTRQ